MGRCGFMGLWAPCEAGPAGVRQTGAGAPAATKKMRVQGIGECEKERGREEESDGRALLEGGLCHHQIHAVGASGRLRAAINQRRGSHSLLLVGKGGRAEGWKGARLALGQLRNGFNIRRLQPLLLSRAGCHAAQAATKWQPDWVAVPVLRLQQRLCHSNRAAAGCCSALTLRR